MSVLQRTIPALFFVAVALFIVGKTAVFANIPSDDNIDNPIIAIEKTAVDPEIIKGGTAVFTITVVNSGDVPLINVHVQDPQTPSCNNNLGTLAPNEEQAYTCQQANVQASFLNEATATGRDPKGIVVSDTDTALINVDNPEISIIKQAINSVIRRNGTAIFTITVFNDSKDNALNGVEVIDELSPSCDREIGLLEPKGTHSYTCTASNITEAFNNVAVVSGTSPASGVVTASDDAQIELLDLEMELLADPALTPEPGTLIKFTAKITNTGSIDVHLTSLSSTRFGNLMDSSNSNVSNSTCADTAPAATLSANGGGYLCEFEATIISQPQVITIDLATIADDDNDDGVNVSETTTSIITISNTPSAISLALEASQPSLPAPGGQLEITATIHNESPVDTVVIDTLDNNILGNLHNQGNCTLPQTITHSNSYSCTFPITITGSAGTSIPLAINASGFDDDTTPGQVADEAQLTVVLTSPLVQYLPITLKNWRTTDEPNDQCAQAYPLAYFDKEYSFLAEDNIDWYYFELKSTTSVQVKMTNFVPLAGQLTVFRFDGVDCNPPSEGGSRSAIGHDGDAKLNKTINLGSRPAGHYLIRVINDGSKTSGQKYKLTIDVP